MKRVSVVIPVYNEEAVIPALGKALTALMRRNSDYDFEIILVDNGSRDNSHRELMKLREEDPRFKIVQLSRNFTADGGVAAGLKFCTGDCAVLMDADLQDPPEVIDAFLAKWEEEYEVVYGVIQSREHVSAFRRLFNQLFYALISSVTQGTIPPNVTAFRLMDRIVYEQLNSMEEANRFTRGLCSWVGFRQVGIPFHRAGRYGGDSKVTFFDLLKEGFDAVFAFSALPLKLISIFGVMLSIMCSLFVIFQFILYAFYNSPFPGYRTLIVVNLMLFGFVFMSLGVIGEYLLRIFDNVTGRPNFIVRSNIGFADLDRTRGPAEGAKTGCSEEAGKEAVIGGQLERKFD